MKYFSSKVELSKFFQVEGENLSRPITIEKMGNSIKDVYTPQP